LPPACLLSTVLLTAPLQSAQPDLPVRQAWCSNVRSCTSCATVHDLLSQSCDNLHTAGSNRMSNHAHYARSAYCMFCITFARCQMDEPHQGHPEEPQPHRAGARAAV
jgi:hypothetical protein